MHPIDLVALQPLIVLAVTLVAIMVQIAFSRRHRATAMLALAGLAVAFATLPMAARNTADEVTALLIVDPYGLFFIGLILAATAATALLAYSYLRHKTHHCEEFYLLLIIAAIGGAVLVTSRHFAALFIGLEILSIALYTLIAYTRTRRSSLEAGLKYLVLAAVSAAFMLFGITLFYVETGTLAFSGLSVLDALAGPERIIMLTGVGLIVIGIAFKLALVPFHMWTPDIYQGAPAPVSAFVATVSKIAVVGVLLRIFAPIDLNEHMALFWIFSAISLASMVGGNLLALLQDDLKRILAYSSIAHMGYLLVAFLVGGPTGFGALVFYLIAYTLSAMGAFGVIALLSPDEGDADRMEDFRGLAYQHPLMCGILTAMLFSLAGIPLTAGFIGKFFLVAAGGDAALWWLVLTLLLTSGVGIFYYLRVVVVMFSRQAQSASAAPVRATISFSGGLVLTLMTLLLVWLGVVPGPLLNMIQTIGW